MNMPNKFVKDLSAEEQRQLIENHQTSNNFRIRNRSHAILLSFQKHSIDVHCGGLPSSSNGGQSVDK